MTVIYIAALAAFYGGLLYFLAAFVRSEPPTAPPSELDVLQLIDAIEDLHNTAQRYQTIENALTDLNNVDNEHLKGVTVDIPSLYEGKGNQYTFVIGEGAQLQHFKELAELERTRLLQELYSKAGELAREPDRGEPKRDALPLHGSEPTARTDTSRTKAKQGARGGDRP